MSNSSLISRIESALLSFRSGGSNIVALAESVRGNGHALEAMPYAMIKEMEDLIFDLEMTAWDDDEECRQVVDVPSVLAQFDAWLAKVPRNV